MKFKLLKVILAGLVLSTSCFINVANAGLIALDSTRLIGNQGYGGSLSMHFEVLTAINVTELGAYDSNQDGFTSQIAVGIYNRDTNTMVTEIATFLGTSYPLTGYSRFFDITDVVLDVGNYAIVARGFNSNDKNGNAGSVGPAPTIDNGSGLIQFVGGGYYGGSSINDFNLTADGGPANRYDAGTFMYTKVPEPSTLAIFALGMIGLASRRYKKKS